MRRTVGDALQHIPRYPAWSGSLDCYRSAIDSAVDVTRRAAIPAARYTKDEPEISAWLRRGTEPPDYDSFGLVKYHYLANQKQTDGDYGLYRVDIAPNGGGRARISTARCPRRSSCCRER